MSESVVGHNIRLVRQVRGLSQGDLAERVHMNQGKVSYYELSRRPPKASLLNCIADVLAVSVHTLLREDLQERLARVLEETHEGAA